MQISGNQLELNRCPHCGVNTPNLRQKNSLVTTGQGERRRRMYACERCGGVVLVCTPKGKSKILDCFPTAKKVDEAVPNRAANFLSQALESLHAPSGAIMLAASSVDAMLKDKGYRDRSLYSRIDEAVDDNLITEEMSQWAHDVRLDANEQRHADGGCVN